MQAGHAFWQLLLQWCECWSAGIWVIQTGAKTGCKLVTLFGGYSYDGLNAAIGVQHTEVANLHKTDRLSKFD